MNELLLLMRSHAACLLWASLNHGRPFLPKTFILEHFLLQCLAEASCALLHVIEVSPDLSIPFSLLRDSKPTAFICVLLLRFLSNTCTSCSPRLLRGEKTCIISAHYCFFYMLNSFWYEALRSIRDHQGPRSGRFFPRFPEPSISSWIGKYISAAKLMFFSPSANQPFTLAKCHHFYFKLRSGIPPAAMAISSPVQSSYLYGAWKKGTTCCISLKQLFISNDLHLESEPLHSLKAEGINKIQLHLQNWWKLW